jgi:hypothetical protein
MEQKSVDEDMLYIIVQDFTKDKEGKAHWKKTTSSEKDNIAFCILCSAKMKAVKVLAEAVKVEAQTNPIELDSWDPFKHGGVIALEGFTYIGKLSFICFGPTSKFFASTLAMGGQLNRTVEKKGMFKEGSA